MISKLKNIKYVLIVASILLIGVALWGATSLIIEESYSSRDIVIEKEMEKLPENTVEVPTEEPIVIEKGSIKPNYLSEEELQELINNANITRE